MSTLGALLAVMLVASPEEAALDSRLSAEAAVLDALLREKDSLAQALAALQTAARSSASTVKALEKEVSLLDSQAEALAREQRAVTAALLERRASVSPKLALLYRLRGQQGIGALLAASDFADVLRRQRVVATLVEREVQSLDDLTALDAHQRVMGRRLKAMEAAAQQALRALKAEQAVAKARLAKVRDAVLLIGAEANLKSRAVAELEVSRVELDRLNAEMTAAAATAGFRSLKGKLPLPAKGGLVEVGFGRVVNPRFNTVTEQKGLDVRAQLGAEVIAVADGTVVYVGELKGYGMLLIVDHGGDWHSLYAHLGSVALEPGDEVRAGEALGQVGDTGSLKGAYLYFELRRQGQAIDPLPWLRGE
jgi:murein hydrolase activator